MRSASNFLFFSLCSGFIRSPLHLSQNKQLINNAPNPRVSERDKALTSKLFSSQESLTEKGYLYFDANYTNSYSSSFFPGPIMFDDMGSTEEDEFINNTMFSNQVGLVENTMAE